MGKDWKAWHNKKYYENAWLINARMLRKGLEGIGHLCKTFKVLINSMQKQNNFMRGCLGKDWKAYDNYEKIEK